MQDNAESALSFACIRDAQLSDRRTWGFRGVRKSAVALSAWGTLFDPDRVFACPDCNLGRVARHQFWNDRFAWHLASAVIPFLVIVAVALWAERIGRAVPAQPSEKRGSR